MLILRGMNGLSRRLNFAALSFLLQTPFPLGHSRSCLYAALGSFGRPSNQCDQTVQRILTIALLGAKALGLDDDNALIGHPFSGQSGQPVTDITRQIGGFGRVEPELDGRGHLVDILPAGSRGTDEIIPDIPFVNPNMGGDLNH